MAHIVVLGAGIGGMPLAYEMKEKLRRGDQITVVSNNANFHFVPSNPWVAVNWRKRASIEMAIGPHLAKKGIAFNASGASACIPSETKWSSAMARRSHTTCWSSQPDRGSRSRRSKAWGRRATRNRSVTSITR